jgi:hypothetical protein
MNSASKRGSYKRKGKRYWEGLPIEKAIVRVPNGSRTWRERIQGKRGKEEQAKTIIKGKEHRRGWNIEHYKSEGEWAAIRTGYWRNKMTGLSRWANENGTRCSIGDLNMEGSAEKEEGKEGTRQEKEDKERGAKPWINEDGTSEDATTKEILMNKTVTEGMRGREICWR